MNCKKGDLAWIVSDLDYGKVVEVLDGPNDCLWWIRGRNLTLDDGRLGDECWIEDVNIRPIRDNPGQDETLDWAPVPTKETA
jgi:hypothetical protein